MENCCTLSLWKNVKQLKVTPAFALRARSTFQTNHKNLNISRFLKRGGDSLLQRKAKKLFLTKL